MTEPATGDPHVADEPTSAEPELVPAPTPLRRLRALPAFAVASMLIAGGLLMALAGISRLAGPAPATPSPVPAVVEPPAPVVTPAPTAPQFPTAPGPSRTPQGDVAGPPAVGRPARGAPGA